PSGRRCPFLAERLAVNETLREDVRAAVRVGVSLKRWNGWEPHEVTEYEYDDGGRVVRTVTTREPEWDDESRAYVLALAEYERSVCGGCGGWLPETTDPKNEGRYVSKGAIRCHRCDVL